MKRIIKLIPDMITSMNLLCGLIGVIFAFKGKIDMAFYMMLAAAVCDFFDGFAARLLKAGSALGKELDSLSDVVSFGVLPSLMLYNLMRVSTFSDAFWCYIPLIIAVFSAWRLAKFNLDERQSESFLGLPTPLCAILCGSLAYMVVAAPNWFLAYWASGYVFIPLVSVVLSVLLVSEVPMFSFKCGKDCDKALKSKRLAFIISVAIIVLLVVVTKQNWSLAILASSIMYIAMNLVYSIFKV